MTDRFSDVLTNGKYRKELIKEIRQYSAETTAMLNKNSVEELKRFCERHCDYMPCIPSDEVLEIVLRKMQANKDGVYPKIKNEARQWLMERGYSEVID